jgi:hypothetical protein
VRGLIVIASGLVAASIVAQVWGHLLPEEKSYGVVQMFNLDAEANLPTYFASLLLVLAALLSAGIGSVIRARGDRWVRHWYGLVLAFLYLSIDESLQLHERAIEPVRLALGLGGWLYFAWIIPASVLLLVFLIAYWRFFRSQPVSLRRGLLWAGLLYVGGAIGFELVGGQHFERFGPDNIGYVAITTLEEGLELAGMLVLIHALTPYLIRLGPVFELSSGGRT